MAKRLASSAYSQADLDCIEKLMTQMPFTGYLEEDSSGEICKISILGRGEMAFFQRGENALLMEVQAGFGYINAKSIKKWHNGKKIDESEKSNILIAMTKVMNRLGFAEVKIFQ